MSHSWSGGCHKNLMRSEVPALWSQEESFDSVLWLLLLLLHQAEDVQ